MLDRQTRGQSAARLSTRTRSTLGTRRAAAKRRATLPATGKAEMQPDWLDIEHLDELGEMETYLSIVI
jgi:hypothetical protein